MAEREMHVDTARELFDQLIAQAEQGAITYIVDDTGLRVAAINPPDAAQFYEAILLYREDVYDRNTPRLGEVDLIAAKRPQAHSRTVTVANMAHYGRFIERGDE